MIASCRSRRFAIVLAVLVMLTYAGETSAQVLYDWINPSGGSWHTGANWFPGAGAPPGADDGAGFGLAATYMVSISQPTTVSDIDVVNGDVAFNVCHVTICGVFTAAALEVSGFGSTPRLTLQNGVMRVDTLLVSNGGQMVVVDNATTNLNAVDITVTGAGSIWTSSDPDIGIFGNGAMNVTAGGRVESSIGDVGFSGGHATVNVSGANSQWINSGQMYVGGFGTGELNVTDGGEVLNPIGHSLIVGDFSHGTITIESGGRVSSYTAALGNNVDSSGTVTVAGANSRWTNSGSFYIGLNSGQGTLSITDGGTVETVDMFVRPLGELNGDGNIVGTVQNRGLVSPGAPVGALNVNGSYSQPVMFEGDRSELIVELASASSFDQLLVSGDAALGGTLTVNLVNSFVPSVGQSFTILTADNVSGTFNTELLPIFPNRRFDVIYNADSVLVAVLPPLPGDYNQDGTVDAADYVVWRKNLGTSNPLPNDLIGGMIGPAHYDQWRAHFGQSAGSSARITSVPEPATQWSFAIGGLAAAAVRRLRSCRVASRAVQRRHFVAGA